MAIIYRPKPAQLVLNRGNPLVKFQGGPKLISGCAPIGSREPVHLYWSDIAGNSGSPSNIVGIIGPGIDLTGASNEYVNIVPSGTVIFPSGTSRGTICIIRRKKDTTNRAATIFSATDINGNTARDRCLLHGPYSDGTLYFDFAGSTAGSSRVSVAGQSFDTNLDSYVLVAGPAKGREIWRRGAKIAADANATASFVGSTTTFRIGAVGPSTPSDSEEVYYIAAFDAEWTDAMCRSWFADPYQVFYKPHIPQRLFQSVPASSSITLAGVSATSASHADTGTIAQTHTLAGASALSATGAATGALTQTQILAGTSALSAGSAGTGTLTQTHTLSGASATSASAADTGAISTSGVLAGTDATAHSSADTGAVGQTHTLAGTAASAASASDTGSLAQTHALTGTSATSASHSDTGTLSQSHTLVGAFATSATGATTGTVLLNAGLIGVDAGAATHADTGAIGQTHTLAGISATGTVSIDTGTLSQIPTLHGVDAGSISQVDTGAITQAHILAGVDATASARATTGAVLLAPPISIVAVSVYRATRLFSCRRVSTSRTIVRAHHG